MYTHIDSKLVLVFDVLWFYLHPVSILWGTISCKSLYFLKQCSILKDDVIIGIFFSERGSTYMFNGLSIKPRLQM